MALHTIKYSTKKRRNKILNIVAAKIKSLWWSKPQFTAFLSLLTFSSEIMLVFVMGYNTDNSVDQMG